MSLRATYDIYLKRFADVKAAMTKEAGNAERFIALSREFSDLEPIIERIIETQRVQKEIAQLEESIREDPEDDAFSTLAVQEIALLQEKLPDLEYQLKVLLLPKDAFDEKNAIIEIRAGAGGDEAGLFAADLFRMYQRYAELQKWRIEVLYIHENELGGVKEASASIKGKGVFSQLKFEMGVHRVQRVPTTEASGRIHTSTATVAVLPEPEEVDVQLEDKDLKIDVMRASGAGGQHVNKTESAVRLTHLPTGLVVFQQDERSQHMNKARAMKILRARLFELERARVEAERAADRKSQVGTGERSERVRTYNFPQGRVTDHRINLTLYKLDKVLAGEALEELVKALIRADQDTRLAQGYSETRA
ncbi:MAG: peptide chain release factor 1 [Holosporales bacterium]|jgi:peptide chain release factor 1|nr:peptide chain release factor 1 [Holosporales bacterium]